MRQIRPGELLVTISPASPLLCVCSWGGGLYATGHIWQSEIVTGQLACELLGFRCLDLLPSPGSAIIATAHLVHPAFV